MTRTVPLLRSQALAILTSAGLLLAVSTVAYAQHSRGGGGSSGGSSHSGSSGGGSSSGGSSGGGHATSSGGSSGGSSGPSRSAPTNVSSGSTSDGGHAVTRGTSGSTGSSSPGNSSAGATTRDSSGDSSNAGNTDSTGTRSRDGRTAVGHAVSRPPNSGSTVIVAGSGLGYYPWAYGGLGFGGYYGYYDPGWYDPYPPVYSGGGGYVYDGALRLKVKPREAAVYVDGYYAGRVDDFDGIFQRLKIDAGPHRVEIRLDGYETLTFDVRIDPDRKTTYEGELKRLP
jgi:PEGA domain-containing protein